MDIKNLIQSADEGSIVSASVLGICYLKGLDVEKDYKKAFTYLSVASEAGSPRAIAFLGKIYEDGLGVERDLNKAGDLYKASVEAGEFLPCVWFARMCLNAGYADPALEYYQYALAFEGKVVDGAELLEAREYVNARKNS